MVQLETLPADTSVEELLKVFKRDGACIVKDILSPDVVDQTMSEVMPYVERTKYGGDDFTGKNTRRTGALIARSPSCGNIVTNELVLSAAKEFLSPFTERIILHVTQTIYIGPGQGAQVFHRDRLAWGDYIPREIEPQFNTIFALTDFTAENGATRVVPGSHQWDWDRRAEDDEKCQAEMSQGSVLLYSGSVLHSGGENRSDASRMGLNLTFCLGWLRQEENQYLSCPPHVAKDLSQELQELLGYTMGSYALGYYSDPLAERSAGILQPETVLGARSRNKLNKVLAE